MERNARMILVTSFVLFTALSIFFFYRWIQTPDDAAVSDQRLVVFSGSVSGLSVGSEVRYLGVPVGRVLSIELNREQLGQVNVLLGADQPLPPSQELIAVLEPLGITGLALVELNNRPEGMDVFDVVDGAIPGYPSIVSQLSGSAGRIATTIEQSLQRLTTVLDEGSMNDLDAVLHQARILSENVAAASERFDEILDSAVRVGGELERSLPELRAAAEQLDQQVLPAVTAAGESIEGASSIILEMAEENREQMKQVVNRELPTVVGATDELAKTLREMNRLLQNINAEPGALLFGEQVKEVEIPSE